MNILSITKKVIGFKKINSFLISFPKSGNTYVRFIFANLLTNCYENQDKVNFFNIEKIVPTYVTNEFYKKKYEIYPVIAKAHNLSSKEIFLFTKVMKRKIIYIYRDPINVMKSYYIYTKKVENYNSNDLSSFIRDKSVGINAWIKNIEKHMLQASYLIQYEEMLDNIESELERLILFLNSKFNLNVSSNIIPCVVKKVSKNNMNKLEKEYKRINKNGELLNGTKVIANYDFVNLKTNRTLTISNSDIQYIKSKIEKIKDKSIKEIILNNYFSIKRN